MTFQKKIIVITDDCSLNLNNDIIEILHPKAQVYNNGAPTFNWRIIKLPFCRERLFNPWIYKALISSYGFLGFTINVIGDGPFTRYARRVLDKEKYPYLHLPI